MLALCLGALVLCPACEKDPIDDGKSEQPDGGEEGKPSTPDENEIDWSKLDSQATVRGVVKCAGKGVAGVVVTDGVNMTRTNEQGAYTMRTSSSVSKFVYISVPSGYEPSLVHKFMPSFYRRITKATSADAVQQFDFTLKKVNQDKHILLVLADIHVRNRAMMQKSDATTHPMCNPVKELDSTTFRRTCIAHLRSYVKSLPAGVKVYGLNLGDVSNESHWGGNYKGDLNNFVTVCERGGMPMPMYTIIGNHEHDMAATNLTTDDDSAAELTYMMTFGPTYYSFDIGKVHYVMLDNVKYINNVAAGKDRDYERRITQDQIDWAAKDAAYMSKDVERVVFGWHCPSFRRAPGTAADEAATKAVLNHYAAKGVPMTILSGHNHTAETVTVKGYANTVEYIHPSVSGAWWYFPLCTDGAPSTFTRYDFDGGKLTFRRSVNFSYTGEQYYRVYNKGQKNSAGKKILRLNVWDWHTDWKFEVWEDDERIQDAVFTPAWMNDPLYVEVHGHTGNNITGSAHTFLNPAKTDHILEYLPKNEAATIKIRAVDEFNSEVFTLTTKIE
ncbi:MAG: calcineurin-like phosphoesterase C-terminal domain-containing protein [Alistipes sp.]|nr:calcineurin-like phosphoesterase C-terminal domain-containing protein [Alistipes sp.]